MAIDPSLIQGKAQARPGFGGRRPRATIAARRLLKPSVFITDESAAEEIIARYAKQ